MRGLVSEYELIVAQNLRQVLALLHDGAGWRPIAGGTDLMVLFNAGRLPYRRLVSIRGLAELREITASEEYVELGAAVTYTEIRNHSLLQSEFPLLCQAASWTGAVANQNRGTLGGNIANASPAADSAPMLLVYDAELQLTSSNDARWVPYSSFHLGYKQMNMRPDELITRIRLPRRANERMQYARKVGTRKAQAISKVCLAAAADRRNNVLRDVRIALGSVAPVPLRCHKTEEQLENSVVSSDIVARAKETLSKEIQPISDIRSTEHYRTVVAANLLGEFLESLL
jgi:CO/xanthine dehydrogenase FAD-binding subunit